MKQILTKAEYDYIVNTKLRSDVDSGMPGHIEDHELIANKIAHAGSIVVCDLYRYGEDTWSMSLVDETAGMYEEGGLTTEDIQGKIDSYLSDSNMFAVYPTDESITNLAGTPLYKAVTIHASGETSLAELLSTLHHRVNQIVQDSYGPIFEVVVPALEDLSTRVEALETPTDPE